jgi:hypothetical protein
MTFLAAILLAASCAGPCAELKCETQLKELVAAVRSADYRGDRQALDRLDAALAKIPSSPLDDYRAYWRGFARWRRAMNGFNETPAPNDLESDLQAAVGHFRDAMEKRPDWIEARLAMVGCFGNLIYLARDDAGKRQAILEQYTPVGKTLAADGQDNPRVLWIIGGLQMGAPPPYGGDMAKAAATLRRTGEPHEPRVPVRAYVREQQDRGARLCAGRARRGARVALRARHSLAADRGDAGGKAVRDPHPDPLPSRGEGVGASFPLSPSRGRGVG